MAQIRPEGAALLRIIELVGQHPDLRESLSRAQIMSSQDDLRPKAADYTINPMSGTPAVFG